jgi:hypothetical protein
MISLLKLTSALGVDRASGLVGAAGLNWPPSQAISLRQIGWSLGHPLAPAGLGLTWDLDVSGKPIIHPPDEQGIPPNRDITMLWSDPGIGQRKADHWVVSIRVTSTGQDIQGSPFALQSAGLSERFQTNNYSWIVTPLNDYGEGASSPEFHFSSVPNVPPPNPNPPPPTGGNLTLQVRISLPAIQQSITNAQWQISGPGAPTTPQAAKLTENGLVGELVLTLPPPPAGQPSVVYTILSTAAFHYDALTGPSGVTGAEDAQADLSQPAQIRWTGQAHTGLFGIRYDGFNNVFLYTFDGLI